MATILLSWSLTAVNIFHVYHDGKRLSDKNSVKDLMVKLIAGISLSIIGWIFFGSLGSAAGMLIGYELATCYQFFSKKINAFLERRRNQQAVVNE